MQRSFICALFVCAIGLMVAAPNANVGSTLDRPLQYDLAVTAMGILEYADVHQVFNTSVTVKNNGTESVADYEVVLHCGEDEIGRLIGIELAPNQTQVFSFSATVDSSGCKTIIGTAEYPQDENLQNNNKHFIMIVRPDPSTGIVFGAGDELLRIPLDLYWKFSLYEALYYPDEIGTPGMIYGISFYMNSSAVHIPEMKIWIGETTLPDLSDGWISAAQLNLVWNSGIAMPSGENEIYIPLAEPYYYQGQNLVLMAYQTHSYYYSGPDFFRAQTLPGIRALKRWTDAYDPDPYNPPNPNSSTGQVPMTAFYLIPTVANVDEALPVPQALGNYPNPFKNRTVFVGADAKAPAIIEIYNLKGQRVQVLNGVELTWDGCDAQGRKLPAGIYLAKLKQRDKVFAKKLCKGE